MAVRGQYDNPKANKSGAFKGGVGGGVASKPRSMQSDIRGGRNPGANPKENKSNAFKGGVGGSVANTRPTPTGVRGAGGRNVDTQAPKAPTGPRGDESKKAGDDGAAAAASAFKGGAGGTEKKAPAAPGSLNYFMKKAGGRKNAAYQMYKNYKKSQKPSPGRPGS